MEKDLKVNEISSPHTPTNDTSNFRLLIISFAEVRADGCIVCSNHHKWHREKLDMSLCIING